MINITQLNDFAALVEKEQIERLKEQGMSCQANIDNCKTKVKIGKKFAKVDVGSSGKFMVDMASGNIFGIKAYGVVHRGHFYGTLDTIAEYFWGNYYPCHKTNPTRRVGHGHPILTFAPEPVKPLGEVECTNALTA